MILLLLFWSIKNDLIWLRSFQFLKENAHLYIRKRTEEHIHNEQIIFCSPGGHDFLMWLHTGSQGKNVWKTLVLNRFSAFCDATKRDQMYSSNVTDRENWRKIAMRDENDPVTSKLYIHFNYFT